MKSGRETFALIYFISFWLLFKTHYRREEYDAHEVVDCHHHITQLSLDTQSINQLLKLYAAMVRVITVISTLPNSMRPRKWILRSQ
jgi:hypothetical protein